jgi:hypothetical protein
MGSADSLTENLVREIRHEIELDSFFLLQIYSSLHTNSRLKEGKIYTWRVGRRRGDQIPHYDLNYFLI